MVDPDREKGLSIGRDQPPVIVPLTERKEYLRFQLCRLCRSSDRVWNVRSGGQPNGKASDALYKTASVKMLIHAFDLAVPTILNERTTMWWSAAR